VPDGTSVNVYAPHGQGIPDSVGTSAFGGFVRMAPRWAPLIVVFVLGLFGASYGGSALAGGSALSHRCSAAAALVEIAGRSPAYCSTSGNAFVVLGSAGVVSAMPGNVDVGPVSQQPVRAGTDETPVVATGDLADVEVHPLAALNQEVVLENPLHAGFDSGEDRP
jgi:hypothetical protein